MAVKSFITLGPGLTRRSVRLDPYVGWAASAPHYQVKYHQNFRHFTIFLVGGGGWTWTFDFRMMRQVCFHLTNETACFLFEYIFSKRRFLSQFYKKFWGNFFSFFKKKLDRLIAMHYFPLCTGMVWLTKRVIKFTPKSLHKIYSLGS